MAVPFYFWFPVLVSVGTGFASLNIPPVSGQFMELLGVGYGGLSLLLSAYYWANTLVQVPAGLLVDRIGVARSLALCIGITLACSLGPLLVPDSLLLATGSRFFLGACSGGFFLATVKAAKVITPPAHISRVQGAQGAAFSLGTMLPYLTLPYFGAYGWVFSYVICALFCLVYAWGMYRLPLKALSSVHSSLNLKEVWRSARVLAASKALWFLGISHGMTFGVLVSVIGNWLPSILVDSSPASTIGTWTLVTGIMLFVGTAGRVYGGELARKVSRGMLLSRIVLVLPAAYWLLAFVPHPAVIIPVGFVIAALCGLAYASVFALGIDTASPACVATSIGIMNMIASLVNVLLVVSLGLARDYTGSFAPGLCVWGLLALGFWLVFRKMAATIDRG